MEEKSCFCAVLGKSILEMGRGLDELAPAYIDMKLVIARKLSELIGQGVTGFVSNAEWGFSLWACEAVLGMQGFNRTQLHIIAPHEEQCMAWTDDTRERWFSVHERADSVRFISRRFHPDCFRICDKAIIDMSGLLLTDDTVGFAAQYSEINNMPVNACGKK